jgi:AcrR family transcriptional regulator
MAARRLSSDERRKQIASVAAELFARRGFAGVTTHEIAKRAKVSEAIVFRHFSTKRALYTEIINQKIKLAPHLFAAERLAKGDDAAVLRSLAAYLIRQAQDDPTFLRLMLYSALEDNELADLFFTERTSMLVDFLLEFVQRRVREGLFRKVHPRAAVRAFLGMILHFILMEELYDLPKNVRISPDIAVDQFVDIFLNGMQQKGQSR